MTARLTVCVVIATLVIPPKALAQQPMPDAPLADRYVDTVNGLTLEQAIARAMQQEPALRAARAQVDVAEGMRLQASLRPNPSVSFERREEPRGSDNQTMVGLEWPLDLFRRGARTAVADREVTATRLGVADRERQLRTEVRMQYGELLVEMRELRTLDELVTTARAQHGLLRARVDEGASPPLERNLLEVEVRRLESDRVIQTGKVDVAALELGRLLGMNAGAALTVRESLDTVVLREAGVQPRTIDEDAVVSDRPDVREAAARIDVGDAKIGRAQAEGRFDVSVFANYMRMDAGFPQRAFDPEGTLVPIRGLFHYASAGAMVTVPLLNRNQGDVAAARAERVVASASFEATRLAAQSELAAARVRDEHARQALQLYGHPMRSLARENLQVIRQSHELGRVTVFDVLAEQRRYLDIERGYTAALKEAYDARTALSRATGGVQ